MNFTLGFLRQNQIRAIRILEFYDLNFEVKNAIRIHSVSSLSHNSKTRSTCKWCGYVTTMTFEVIAIRLKLFQNHEQWFNSAKWALCDLKDKLLTVKSVKTFLTVTVHCHVLNRSFECSISLGTADLPLCYEPPYPDPIILTSDVPSPLRKTSLSRFRLHNFNAFRFCRRVNLGRIKIHSKLLSLPLSHRSRHPFSLSGSLDLRG